MDGLISRVLRLALGPAVALGLGRFGYGLLLPSMQAAHGWSWAEAGWLNTANALGYLAGALAAAGAVRHLGAGRTFRLGLGVVLAALAASALLRGLPALAAVRTAAGLGGAFAFVAGGVIVSDLAPVGRAGLAIALYYAGNGAGLLISALALPTLAASLGSEGWPWGWAALAVLGLPAALLAMTATGEADEPDLVGRLALTASELGLWRHAPVLAGYTLFGMGSIGYMTFMAARLQAGGGGAAGLTAFWALIGLSAMISPWLWAGVLNRARGGGAVSATIGVNAAGAMLPLLWPSPGGVTLSAILFGLSFFTSVAATTAYVRGVFAPEAVARGIGIFTVAFGLGQAVGPVLCGYIADVAGDLTAGLWAGSALAAGGAVLALLAVPRAVRA